MIIQPKVSIIVTSYNTESYIQECLESIVHQTLRDIEIIIIDDGSTDSTVDIVKAYASRDRRIITHFYAQNTIGGMATPANKGIELATGEYIGFVGSDDWCDLTMFEKLYIKAKTTNADFTICKYVDVYSNGTQLVYEESWQELLTPVQSLVETKKRLLKLSAHPFRKLYKQRFFKENHLSFPIGPYPYEDIAFHWKCILAADAVELYNDEYLYFYRQHTQQLTHVITDTNFFLGFSYQYQIVLDFLHSVRLEAIYQDNLIYTLILHINWISQIIDPMFSNAFYDFITHELAKYRPSLIYQFMRNYFLPDKVRSLLLTAEIHEKEIFTNIILGR